MSNILLFASHGHTCTVPLKAIRIAGSILFVIGLVDFVYVPWRSLRENLPRGISAKELYGPIRVRTFTVAWESNEF